MMADDVDMEKVAEKVPVVPNETSAKSDKMFSLKRWNAVAMWSWGKMIIKSFFNLFIWYIKCFFS